jgi:hypothetical protein
MIIRDRRPMVVAYKKGVRSPTATSGYNSPFTARRMS